MNSLQISTLVTGHCSLECGVSSLLRGTVTLSVHDYYYSYYAVFLSFTFSGIMIHDPKVK